MGARHKFLLSNCRVFDGKPVFPEESLLLLTVRLQVTELLLKSIGPLKVESHLALVEQVLDYSLHV